jgi:hypothetical protein
VINKFAVIASSGFAVAGWLLVSPAVGNADPDSPCLVNGVAIADCEVLVDFASYDYCIDGGNSDLALPEYGAYNYFDCVQAPNGSWHVLLHNG